MTLITGYQKNLPIKIKRISESIEKENEIWLALIYSPDFVESKVMIRLAVLEGQQAGALYFGQNTAHAPYYL
jgi:hypothetical protein